MNLSQSQFDFKANWDKLRDGLDLIVKICQGAETTVKSISFADWQQLYYVVYTWCTRQEEKKKEELYNKVAEFFESVVHVECEQMKSKQGYILLKDYLQRFDNFTSATGKIKNIFAYMHRYWIPSQVTNGDSSVRPIFELSLVKWRDKAYGPLQGKLLDALMHLVTAERDGEKVDKTLLSNMVQSYIKIGVPPAENPVVYYKKEFQDTFIKTTREYYQKESDAFIQSNSVSAYMQKGEERIMQEEALAQTYLHPSTKTELIKACEDVLIERHNQTLQDEFQKMLRDDKSEDMRRFYYLLSRIDNGLTRSAETLKQYLASVGSGIVRDYSEKLKKRDDLKTSGPLIFDLLNLHKKYSDILKRCMQDSKLFGQALDEAFTVFINMKAGIFFMSEILNAFVDGVMTGKEHLADDQTYEQLDSVVRLFTYFNDKDLFYDGFRRSLSKRLLTQKIKEDWERHFLQRLKVTCGDTYTKKLEGMFNDVKISKDQYNPNYKSWLENKGKNLECQMTVTVLNENYWPATNRITLNPDSSFSPNMKCFEDFYGCAAQKKLLTWILQSGDSDVHYTFIAKAGAKPLTVELNISCTQACIVLLFNVHKQIRFKDMLETLGTTEEHLKYSMTPLLYTKERVIVNKGPDGKGKKELDSNGNLMPVTWDSLAHDDYLSPCPVKTQKRRQIYQHIKPLPPGSGKPQAPVKVEEEEDVKAVLKERELKMQLALVRVMKARNVLQVQQLIAEATEQLSKYFIPETRLMRKQIEVLMERGFMKRDEEDQRKIHYVA
jgi:cullin 1